MRSCWASSATWVAAIGWLLGACGARSELLPGVVENAAGTAGTGGSPSVECVTSADCPAPPPEQCGRAQCVDGACLPLRGAVCDDGDPCTTDSCESGSCVFVSARVDADGDGVFATGNRADPRAALGCGKDCDDADPATYPGAPELCDARDNDCNGVADDGTSLTATDLPPQRVSAPDAARDGRGGLAFDGQLFGATLTTTLASGTTQGQFQQLSLRGKLLGAPQRIAHVNARTYAGPLVWTGERYLTAYQDARQAENYEIYFDLLNRSGERLIEDLRVTNADDYSLDPSVLWTGAEALLLWNDRRFEGNGDAAVLMGQRVSFDGKLIGANLRLTPAGVTADSTSAALTADGVGVAFTSPLVGQPTALKFMTASRSLAKPSIPIDIPFLDASAPVVTALDDEFVVTFNQKTNVVGPSIFGVVLSKHGSVLRLPQSMTAGATHARGNATFSYGDRFLMVWADDRSGSYQLWAQVFDKKLAPISPRIAVTTSMTNAIEPSLAAASDGGIGVLFTDENNGSTAVYFTRLDCQSRPLGLK
jgi:hypothetical protein